jgi:2-polyprenyl-6-methoxyphenol hydroxylase-like FAD-dependent oxidoreductase
MADVLIAGGGIAGSSLAILLGRQGLTVELYERGRFPKEKPCGEGLMPGGVAVLDRLGLAEAVGGAPFYGVRYHFGSQTAQGRFPSTAGFPAAGRGQRRRHLDHVLFEAAITTPGVTAHCGVEVDGPLTENGRVAGLVVQGQPRRAKLVVAAEGIHSRIRHLLGLDVRIARKRFGARTHFRLAPGQEQPPWVDVFVSPGHELYVTPLPNRELLVAALADKGALQEPFEQVFHGWWRSETSLAARLEGAEQVTPLLCASPLSGGARCGVAPGVVLLGDAAGFLDPITGGGMTQALMTAELLAQYTRRGLTNTPAETDDWLWDFERERRRMLADYRALTQMVLWLADHPNLAQRLIGALRVAPSILSHLIGVSAGMRPLWRFAPTTSA